VTARQRDRTADYEAFIQAAVDAIPPLNDEQRARISVLLKPARAGDPPTSESSAA
jgi:hypothetical protein